MNGSTKHSLQPIDFHCPCTSFMVDWATMFGFPVSVFLSIFLTLPNVTLFTLFGHDFTVNTFAICNQCHDTIQSRITFFLKRSISANFCIYNVTTWSFIVIRVLMLLILMLTCCIWQRFMRSFHISIMSAAVNIMKSGFCHWRWHIHPTTECVHTSLTLDIFTKSNNFSSVYFISLSSRCWLCSTALLRSIKLYVPFTFNTR